MKLGLVSVDTEVVIYLGVWAFNSYHTLHCSWWLHLADEWKKENQSEQTVPQSE